MSTSHSRAKDNIPKPAHDVINIMKSMGVEEYEPRVVNQLLDFMYRHVSEVLQDAEAFKVRCTNKAAGEVGLQEVIQAIQSRAVHSFTQPPSEKELSEVAELINKRPLPQYKKKHGLMIPQNDDDYLAGPNYQFKPADDPVEDDF